MKQVSNGYKANIKKFGKQIDSIITYNSNEETITLGASQLNAITPSFEGAILKSVMKQIVIDSNVEIPVNTQLNYKFGVLVDNNYEYIDFGDYIVYKVEKKEDTNSYEIIAYDKMLNTMIDYDVFGITYPTTIRSYLIALCDYLQISFANAEDNFVNYDKTIESELYVDAENNSLGYTFRDVLDQLAEVTASTICINNNNQLELRYISEVIPIELSKNLLNESLGFQNGYISAQNVYTSDNKTALYNQYIQVEGGETYTFSTNANVDNMVISMYDSGDTFLGRQKLSNVSSLTQTMASNVAYVRYAVNYNNSSTMTQQILDNLEVMIEVGSARTSPYEPYIEPIPDAETFDETSFKNINVNFGEKFGPINSIVLSRAGDSDSIYLKDDESIAQNGLYEIKISENQILNFNNRDEYIQGIYNQLNGLEYYINDYSSPGITYLELCDRYNVQIGENIYPCIMFNDELLVTQGLEENIHTDMPDMSETNYTKADKTDRRINQTYIIANKQEGEIEALTSRTTFLEDGLNNVYTKEQVDTLIINSETGVTNTFSEAGGNNIFRNTGLWFENTGENDETALYPSSSVYPSTSTYPIGRSPYEFWSGIVLKTTENKSANRNALLLQATMLSQEQQVPNGKYTVSFKYKKLLPLANAKVIINDDEYSLSEDGDAEFLQTIDISSQKIKVKFSCDTNNGFEIYDVMVNAGGVKLAYSQNQNETTTDTVNISKGITITSTADENIEFRADYDGIRVYDRNNMSEPITYFTEKGMTTKEMVVENKSEISGVLIQPMGNQTWFTKI